MFNLIKYSYSFYYILNSFKIKEMHKDWNDVKDQDDDSWDDDQKQPDQQVTNDKPAQEKSTQQNTTNNNGNQNKKQQKLQRQRPKFLKDEEIIQQIKNKTIQQRKKLKFVNCINQDVKVIVTTHKLISYFKQLKEGLYIACFKTEEDTIAFIQQKIQKRYLFFIHPYIKTAKDIQRQKQREQRMQERQKQRKNNKNDGYYQKDKQAEKGKTYKPKHQTEESNFKNKEKKQSTQHNRNRPQYDNESEEDNPKKNQSKQKKIYQAHHQKKVQKDRPLNFEIKDNYIRLLSNQFSRNQVVDTIQYLKILKDFKVLRIYAPKNCLQKALQLCQKISQRLNWGLQKVPSQKEKQKETIQLTLKEGLKMKVQDNQYKTLKGNPKKYFQDVQKRNKFKISSDFSFDQYLKGFKDNQKAIFKNFNKLSLKAEGEDIPQLLKLSWILKKDQSNNIQLKVGSSGEIPYALIQITEGQDKQKRPKVDASMVNSYLTN